MTPSSVSRSVARLERALGCQLLMRSTRKVGLTASGSDVFQQCQGVVNAAKAVMELGAHHAQEPNGHLRISVPKAVGRYVLHPHMPAFLKKYPKVDVQVILDDRHLDLIDHQIDAALRITETPPVGLIGRQLMNIEHCICATPAYLESHGIPNRPLDLATHQCIYLGESPADAKWKFVKDGRSFTVDVRGRYAANHTGVRLDAVCQGLGIGSLPLFVAHQSLANGSIRQLLPDWRFVTSYTGPLWLLYSPSKHMPRKLRVFIDHLAECLGSSRAIQSQ